MSLGFCDRLDIPWVSLVWEKLYPNGKLWGSTMNGSFSWKGNLKILKDFKELTIVQVQNGQTCQLWEDNWMDMSANSSFLNSSLLQETKSFLWASKGTHSVQWALSPALFWPGLHSTAKSVQHPWWHTSESGKWLLGSWGSNLFAATKAYKNLVGQHTVHPAFKWLRRTYCQPKIKVFFWLLLEDRLSTRNILRRKICIWSPITACSVIFLQKNQSHNLQIPDQASLPQVSTSQGSTELWIIMCWSIWGARNSLIFRGINLTIQGRRQ